MLPATGARFFCRVRIDNCCTGNCAWLWPIPALRRSSIFCRRGQQVLIFPLVAATRQGKKGRVKAWESLVAGRKPALLLSVNLRGLDPDGRVFYFCRALGVPVALWFVDNPWHLLSALRLPWWREAALFVTDASFLPGLRAAGARQAFHLPLAAAQHMWQEVPEQIGHDSERTGCASPLFVGRSAFPERDRFFAAARVPPALMAEAAALQDMRPRQRPHAGYALVAAKAQCHALAWTSRARRGIGRGALRPGQPRPAGSGPGRPSDCG